MSTRQRSGFTLVELSIVLVIIGLLIGGILVGQSLIDSSKLQSLVKQIQQYEIAAQNFKVKYNSLPGDSVLFEPPGDGNGKIYSDPHMFNIGSDGGEYESFNFWRNLHQAGQLQQSFIGYDSVRTYDGDFTGYAPKLNYGKECFLNAFTIDDPSGVFVGDVWTISSGAPEGLGFCMSASEAMAVDAKLDDGKPETGEVVVGYSYSGPIANGVHYGCNETYGAPNSYDIKGLWNAFTNAWEASPPVTDRIECQLTLKAKWY
jgi:prepilin-type N-terminal cleavage/methylation domain-containing protein